MLDLEAVRLPSGGDHPVFPMQFGFDDPLDGQRPILNKNKAVTVNAPGVIAY
jgi:hypothetical protein